jgi:hypothetical protein
MPNIKGATWDPVAKKFIMPEGYVKPDPKTKKERQKVQRTVSEELRRRDPGPTDRKAAFEVLRNQERASQTYAVFAMYPGQPRAFIGYTSDPTHAAIAKQWGGGDFQVVPYDQATGSFIGEPASLRLDVSVHAPLLPGFKTAQPGYGQMNQILGGMPGGLPPGYGILPPAKNADVEDLEDELDDLEKELGQIKGELVQARRERDEAIKALSDEKERALRAEMEQRFQAQIAELKTAFAGNRKDPLEQLLEFKRVEAELNPSIGRGNGGPGEMMGALMGLFEMVLKAKDKLGEDNPGGATGGFLETIKSLTPLLEKVMDNRPQQALLAAPAVAPTPTATPAPQPQEQAVPPAVHEAVNSLFNYLGTSAAAGIHPVEAAAWITRQQDRGWAEVHGMILADDPANFLDVAQSKIPEAVDNDQKKAWMKETLSQAREKLQKAA